MDSVMPWYCWNRDHAHSTSWEAENCTELHELYQDALQQIFEVMYCPEVEKAMQRFHSRLEEVKNRTSEQAIAQEGTNVLE